MFGKKVIRGSQLYRSSAAAVMLAALLGPASAWAQHGPMGRAPAPAKAPEKKKKTAERPPRGLAVVVWRADPEGNAQPRLLPISIFFQNKFFDASVYYSSPRPMALEVGNYFEVQQTGQRIGYFTVQNALPPGRSGERRWAGLGDWESAPPRAEFRRQVVAAEAVRDGAALIIPEPDEQEQQRELKRKDVTVYDEQGHPMSKEDAAKPEPEPAKKGNPETLDRAPSVIREKPKPKDSGPKDPDDDPDRPRYGKKKDDAKAPAVVTMDGPMQEHPMKMPEDPDRPVLRRGKPQLTSGKAAGKKEDESVAGLGPVPTLIAERGGESVPGGTVYFAAAVSDAENTIASGDFAFKLGEEERSEQTAKMAKLARAEVEKYLATMTQGSAPAKPEPKRKPAKKGAAPPAYFDVQEMRAFDVDLNNSAELVFTAIKRSAASAPVFVTLVARVTIEGEPRKLFAGVTRGDRLESYPRLALVDAVDADGKGRADLLFRRIRGEHNEDFILYRVDPDGLTERFHGGGTE